MIFLDELKPMRLYKKQFILPINDKNKKKGACTFLLTPNFESTKRILNSNLIDKRYYQSYYIEKDITYFINQEGYLERLDDKSFRNVINEDKIINESKKINIPGVSTDEDLSQWMKTNIKYKEYTKLMTAEEVYKERKGSCHDQCIFEEAVLTSLGYKTGRIFFIEYNDTDPQGGRTHTLVYYIKDKRIYWFENAWEEQQGIHGPYMTLLDIENDIKKIHSKEPSYSKYPNLEFNKLKKKYNFGCDLNEFVQQALNEADDYVLNDPKKLQRSLKFRMHKAKHALNKMSDAVRNNVGTVDGTPNLGMAPKGTQPGTDPGAAHTEPTTPTNVKQLQDDEDKTKRKLGKQGIDKGKSIIDKPVEEEFLYEGTLDSEYEINNMYMRCNDTLVLFNDMLDEQVISEAGVNYNSMLYKLLYKERFKTNKEVFDRYDQVLKELPFIHKTYIGYDRYKKLNLFIDLSFYNQVFFKNNMYNVKKSHDLYFEFISRFINDKRLPLAGYINKTLIIPIHDWIDSKAQLYNFTLNFNPLSMITKLLKQNPDKLIDNWGGIQTVFMSEYGYFRIDFANMDKSKDPMKILTLIEKLRRADTITDADSITNSKKAMVADITDKLEKSQGIKIYNLTGKSGDIDKDELVQRIDDAASKSTDVDDTIEKLDNAVIPADIINQLAREEDNNVRINAARAKRIKELDTKYLDKTIKGKKVSDLLKEDAGDKELPVTEVEIDTVNEEWKHLQYINFEKVYDIDEDIALILRSLSEKSHPVSIVDINVEDISTSEDLLYTYTVKCEDYRGTRFTLKFDVPKFKNGKFMRLRGNDKTINAQLTQIPICKTDEDAVQIVSNYKKIFVYRFGNVIGKSYETADRLLKTFRKYTGKDVKITLGDNSKVCNKYDLPMDYIDMAREISKIETQDAIFYFNQDELRSKYDIDETMLKHSFPIGYNKRNKKVIYCGNDNIFSNRLYGSMMNINDLAKLYDTTKPSVKYAYSQASILNNRIPLIVVVSYSIGLSETLKRAKINYEFSEKRLSKSEIYGRDVIKFKDGYLYYGLNYYSSLLMNGLKECDTANYTISEIDGKSMWLDFLDIFGGRLLADGLDNFYDLMIDPITKEVAEYYKLPSDYISLLLYANDLLSDNEYTQHGDMNARRYRSNELLAGYVYSAIADSYGQYTINLKRTNGATMTIRRTEVIDRIMKDPTFADLSKLTPVLEAEAANATTYKGIVGMNADRAYSLDKRTYTDSMANILGMSTGFAGNVGITRQATIDMNVKGKRGYLKTTNNKDDYSITKTFTVTEALTPFGSRRDDPFRTAMTYIQTSKHGMRVKNSMPMLISNGCDQALPYLVSDTFAFKAKENGKVIEKTDDYMVIQYLDNTKDVVDLRRNIEKNSDGGFFITLKLDSDLKVGSKVKKGEIVAYDKESFSNAVGGGSTNDLAYSIGPLAKVAILNTDENFEDSAIISDWLADAMSSDVIVQKEITLPKNTNILFMAKKGQKVQEGDPILIFQNAFEEDDVNFLLKTLADENEDEISDLGRIPIKSKVTGWIQDIKIYRTVEKDELSPSLKKIVNSIEKPINDINKVVKNNNSVTPLENTDPTYKLDATGKLKNAEDSVLIEFYLGYNDRLSIGDKIIYYSANKGVVKDIFPKGKEPYTDYDKKEKIQSMMGVSSINGRMVCSPMIVGAINKVLIELDKKVKEMAGIPYKYLNE